ncbi:AAA-ATPase At3g28540-like [Papaver somniferum]|uniref:AAA-ATPase At3g28540-like n=1 Tax=Papaver somniferum TaxID=3469 RepID=UPI000E6FAA0A|nr:AAA-ATPase At3g28540-like [Papaver somniferum]
MWEIRDWAILGTSLSSIIVLLINFVTDNFFPHGYLHELKEQYITPHFNRLTKHYAKISIDEYPADQLIDQKNQSYTYTEAYLSTIGIKSAMQLKAFTPKNSSSFLLTMVDYEMSITDEYYGTKFSWKLTSAKDFGKPRKHDEEYKRPRRSLTLSFRKQDRLLVTDYYLNHVMEKGKEVLAKNQQRKLYTNHSRDDYEEELWGHVVFNHPASFDTLAMDAAKKADIMDDLIAFSKAKDYYATTGKAWKRGYLLYGPPGTGKSSMIAAISKFMNYDIYDLELKAVKRGNSELRKLLLDTSDRSIIVIEDIDCNMALTNKRKTKKKNESKEEKSRRKRLAEIYGDQEVTLSGLLNFIDGLWSSTGGERFIIFTTNHVEKLDPALIRRGRMDKHIEMSYCCFEGFKILAKNYLKIDDHPSFEKIRCMIDEAKITPADVAENLMPKTVNGGDHSEVCLGNLITALEKSKEDAARREAEKLLEEEEESSEEESDEEKDDDL